MKKSKIYVSVFQKILAVLTIFALLLVWNR